MSEKSRELRTENQPNFSLLRPLRVPIAEFVRVRAKSQLEGIQDGKAAEERETAGMHSFLRYSVVREGEK